MKLFARSSGSTPSPAWSNQAEFEALVRDHFGMVHAIALARLRQHESAEDLTQEVFLRAFLQFPPGKGAKALRPWLICVTRNLAVDWVRRRQTASLLVAELQQGRAKGGTMATEHPLNARERLEEEERDRALEQAMSALGDEQREVLLLHYMEGLSKREVAGRLGVHPSTVGRQIDQALAALKLELEPKLRGKLAGGKPGSRLLARTTASIAAVAALSANAQAALIAGPAIQQGGSVVAAANSLAASGGSLIPTASIGAKGAVIMGTGKLVGIVTGVVLVVGVGIYGFERVNAVRTMPADGRSAPTALTPPVSIEQALPPLPPGWDLRLSPSRGENASISSGQGTFMATGLDIHAAIGNAWQSTPVKVIDPAVAARVERLDVALRGPANTSHEEFKRVLQVEVQRAYELRGVVEKRTVPSLILKAPNGVSAKFVRSNGGTGSVRGGLMGTEFKGTSISSFVDNVALNRQMPVINETGITGIYDLRAPRKYWEDDALKGLGFALSYAERETEVLFVTPAK